MTGTRDSGERERGRRGRADRALHGRTVEHHQSDSDRTVSSPDGSAVAVPQARAERHLGEVRDAEHRFRGSPQPGHQQKATSHVQSDRGGPGRNPGLREDCSRP